jgi:hypothetical protein
MLIGPADGAVQDGPVFEFGSFAEGLAKGVGCWRLSDTHRVQLETPLPRQEALP